MGIIFLENIFSLKKSPRPQKTQPMITQANSYVLRCCFLLEAVTQHWLSIVRQLPGFAAEAAQRGGGSLFS